MFIHVKREYQSAEHPSAEANTFVHMTILIQKPMVTLLAALCHVVN